MANLLQHELDVFLENVALTNSMFYQTSTHLKNKQLNLLKRFERHNQEKNYTYSALANEGGIHSSMTWNTSS